MASTSVSTLRGSVRTRIVPLLTLDGAKSILFYYVLLSYSLKLHRHLRARGLVSSAKELYQYVASVRVLKRIYPALNFCSAQFTSSCGYQPFRRKSVRKWTRPGLTSRTSSFRRARTWSVTSCCPNKANLSNGSSQRWTRWILSSADQATNGDKARSRVPSTVCPSPFLARALPDSRSVRFLQTGATTSQKSSFLLMNATVSPTHSTRMSSLPFAKWRRKSSQWSSRCTTALQQLLVL